MTAKEAQKVLGQVVLVRDGEVLYEATVTDVKTSYNTTLYHVVPVAGCGHRWVKDYVHDGE